MPKATIKDYEISYSFNGVYGTLTVQKLFLFMVQVGKRLIGRWHGVAQMIDLNQWD